jgi:DNA-directed RNA polymerase specialized sigma24 family protein
MLADEEINLEELLRENLGMLYRYSLRLACGSADLAEELLMEAVVRAARSPGTMAGVAADRAWLLGLLTDVHRERGTGDLERPNQRCTPAIPGEESSVGLVRVMDGADFETRAAWWLGVIEGLGIREVSQVLEIPEESVKARLERAQGMLRAKLYELACAASVSIDTLQPIPNHSTLAGVIAEGSAIIPL